MNSRQKSILVNFFVVIVITILAIGAMANFKNHINRKEAYRAMSYLAERIMQYNRQNDCIPPQRYVEKYEDQAPGHERLKEFHYRARWIRLDAPDDTILAYSKEPYRSMILGDKYLVLRLDGTVEFLSRDKLDSILKKQQDSAELQMLSSEP